MKQRISISAILGICALMYLLTGCASPLKLEWANLDWHLSDYYCRLIDKDTTYQISFGNILKPETLTIVSSADSVAKYPGMDRFIADILHTAHLDGAEILFYEPHMLTMFVIPRTPMPHVRPSTISSPMADEKPYTSFMYEDDFENWTRENTEMYTYTYFDKRKKRMLVVDCYDYGDVPVAQITIFQCKNRMTDRMRVPANFNWHGFFIKNKFKMKQPHIEFWSHQVENRRKLAFENYRIGQEQKLRKK